MKKKPNIEPIAQHATGVVVTDAPHAPVIYFEGVPNGGDSNGIVNLTLAVGRQLANGQTIKKDAIAIAHLRCTVRAAKELRDAIDKVLLLRAKTSGQAS